MHAKILIARFYTVLIKPVPYRLPFQHEKVPTKRNFEKNEYIRTYEKQNFHTWKDEKKDSEKNEYNTGLPNL